MLLVPPAPLKIGARMSSFEPVHLTGANKGTKACPICTYVDRPGVQIWTDASAKSLDRAFALAAEVEAATAPEGLVGFLVVVPTASVVDGSLTARAASFKKVAVTRLASATDPATGFHRFTPGGGPMVLTYLKRRTTAVLPDPKDGETRKAVEAIR